MKLCVSLSPLLLYLFVSLRRTCLGDSMRRFNCNACKFFYRPDDANQGSYVDYIEQLRFDQRQRGGNALERCHMSRLETNSVNASYPTITIMRTSSDGYTTTVSLPLKRNAHEDINFDETRSAGSLRAFAYIAAHQQWNSVALITDGIENNVGRKSFFGLENKINLVVPARPAGEEEVASLAKTIQASERAAYVACSTSSCYAFFERILRHMNGRRNFTFVLNEQITEKISLGIVRGTNSLESTTEKIKLVGLRKYYSDWKLLKKLEYYANTVTKCADLSNRRCELKRAHNLEMLIALYDAVELVELFCRDGDEWGRKLTNQVSLFAKSATVLLNEKSIVHNAYDLLELRSRTSLEKMGEFYDGLINLQPNLTPQRKKRTSIGKHRVRRATKCSPAEIDPKTGRPHFKITTIEEPPFLFLDPNRTSEGPHYGDMTGYIVEMILDLSRRMNFNFTMTLVPDGKYGSIPENETEHVSGMVGQILRCDSDLAASAMSITATRLEYLSFPSAWMDYGLVLYRTKLTPEEPKLLAFLDPFDTWLWVTILGCLFAMAILLAIIQWISPYARRRRPQRHDHGRHGKVKGFGDAIWLLYVTTLQQEPDYVSFISGKILLGGWFLFCLIVVSTYTANLAAFLTLQRIPDTIKTVDDLASQTEIPYGTVSNSAIERFFYQSDVKTYKEMGAYMKNNPSALVETAAEGLKRTLEQDYYFIWDSNVLDFMATRDPCTTETIGKPFDNRGYGMAMPQGMPYLRNFSLAILQMKDDGTMAELRDKWLDFGQCDSSTDSSVIGGDGDRVGIKHLAGVLLVLGVAGVLAFFIALVEKWIWSCSRGREVDVVQQNGNAIIGGGSNVALPMEGRENYAFGEADGVRETDS